MAHFKHCGNISVVNELFISFTICCASIRIDCLNINTGRLLFLYFVFFSLDTIPIHSLTVTG